MNHWLAVHQDFSPVILKLEQVSGTPGGLVKSWTAAPPPPGPQSSDSVGWTGDFERPRGSREGCGLSALRTIALVPFYGIGTLELNPKGKVYRVFLIS